jgi:putative MATE family efflux protein
MSRDSFDAARASLSVSPDNQLIAPSTRLELIRTIWSLAWPAIATFGLESLVGLVDTVMVGYLGAASVAGVGVATQVFYAVNVVMMAVSTGTIALVARHVGAGERREAEDALLQSLLLALFLAFLAATAVFCTATPLVAAFGLDTLVASEGVAYLRFMMLGVPSAALFAVVGGGLRGAGDMRTPLVLGAIVNTLNVVGNYLLIFGNLGFPQMGVRGAALASGIAITVGVLLAFVHLSRQASVLRLYPARLAINLAMVKRVLAIGAPTGVEHLLMQVGFMLYLAIAALYGTTAVAAYIIGVRILAVSFLPGFGFSAAASTIVGQRLGAKQADGAQRGGWQTTRLAVVFMSTAGLLIFIGARSIAALFIDDEAVIDEAVSFIRILAVAQPLMATDFTLGGALRGAGDTRFPLWTVLVGFYGARLGCAWLAANTLGLSITWVWLALLGDYVLRAALKGWRFRSDAWKQIRV